MAEKSQPLPDVVDLAAQINAASREAEKLVGSVSYSQLCLAFPGGWSVAQCLDHLAKVNLLYCTSMRDSVTLAMHLGRAYRRNAIAPGWIARKVIARIEPDSGSKFVAPASVVPAPDVDARAALRDFLSAQRSVVNLLHEAAALDLNSIRFKNPFLTWARFSVGTGFHIIAAHNRRHMAQAARVAATIPRAGVATSGR
jgi:DinB superfamily